MQRPLKIAIGVHGRFHAFDVAKALHHLGQEVTLFTNYPAFASQRFGLEGIQVRSFTLHGAVTRGMGRIGKGRLLKPMEAVLHQWFGRWLAQSIPTQPFDVLDVYSGIAEETLNLRRSGRLHTPTILERGSAHIRTQSRLLHEEEQRTGAPQDKPSSWMTAREEREYDLTDHINLLSSFAHRTFTAEGISKGKITVTPLGVNVAHFRANQTSIQERLKRIVSLEPLQVMYVGRVGYQKGFWDFAEVVHSISQKSFHFMLVGSIMEEVEKLRALLPATVQFIGHKPQQVLSHWYEKGDIFLYPTIQDGFGMVLAQAQAAGLPIIATTNCSAPDFLEEGKNGWIVPIRAPQQIVEQLQWCHTHRAELAAMVEYTYQNPVVRDWLNVGRDYLTLMQRLVAEQ